MRRRSQRGAILVYVAISLTALMGFGAMVIDFGVFWLARRQAQNAADAGALAGAITRVYDEPSAAGALTSISASTAASADKIIGDVGTIAVNSAVPCPAWPGAPGGECVQVNVTNTSPLPVYFLPVFGQVGPAVQATAMSRMSAANATNCLKPWILPDLGYTRTNLGDSITLELANVLAPNFYKRVDLGNYLLDIQDCAANTFAIGDTINTLPGVGLLNLQNVAMAALFALDPLATWDGVTNTVTNSCALTRTCVCPGLGLCANGLRGQVSPLVVPVALVSPSGGILTPGAAPVQITNIVGLFVDPALYDVATGTIGGHIAQYPGIQVPTANTVPFNQALNVRLMLVN